MGYELVLPSGLVRVPDAFTGGGGVPVWTFGGPSGGASPGQFTTNNVDVVSTATLEISSTSKQGGFDWTQVFNKVMGDSSTGATIIFTSTTTGKAVAFEMRQPFNDSVGIWTLVQCLDDTTLEVWDGDYSITFGPIIPDISDVLIQAGITPVADSTQQMTNIVTEAGGGTITTKSGVITDIVAPTSVEVISDGIYTISGSLGGTITIQCGLITGFTGAG